MKGLITLALALLAGCGEVVNNNTDADDDTDGDTDGDTDADTPGDTDGDIVEPDGPPQPMSTRFRALSFNGDGLPVLDSTFIVMDASGGIVGSGPVDIEGYFSIELTDQAIVTLVRKNQDDASERFYTLETLYGVQPGDDLVFGIFGRPAPVYTSRMSTVVSKVPMFTQHTLSTPCYSADTNVDGFVDLQFTDACHGATFEVFGYAAGGPTADRFFYEPAQTFQAGQSFIAPAFDSTVRPFTMSLVNLPPDINTASVYRSTLLGTTSAYSSSVSARAPVGSADLALTYPPFTQQRVETHVDLFPETGLMYYLDDARLATVGSLHTVDFAEQPLPVIDTLTVDQTGYQWTESANSGTGDMTGMFGTYRWTDDTQRVVEVEWRVFGPSFTSPLVLPRLPGEFESLDPQGQTVAVDVFGGIVAIEVDRMDGYDQVRPVFDMTLYSSDEIEVLYPGEAFKMRRMQAVANQNQGLTRSRPNLFLSARGRGPHAAQ